MNGPDDLEIKRKMCSRLPIEIVRATKVFNVADQAHDSGRRLLPIYEKEKDKEVKVNWVDVEGTDLRELMRPVLINTKRWVEPQTHILQDKGIQVTFQMMGEVESFDDERENESHNESAAQSSHSKGSQQKEVNEEEHPKKKLKSSQAPRPSSSTSSVHQVEVNPAVGTAIDHGMSDKGKQQMVQDKVVSPKPGNDKAGSDTYVNIEDDEEQVTSPP